MGDGDQSRPTGTIGLSSEAHKTDPPTSASTCFGLAYSPFANGAISMPLYRQTYPLKCTCGHETQFVPEQMRTDLWIKCERCGADLSRSVAEILRELSARGGD